MFIHLSLTALAPTLTVAAIQRLLPEEPIVSISLRESSSGIVVILQTRTEDEAKQIVAAWTRTVLGCALLTAGYTFSNSSIVSASYPEHEVEEAVSLMHTDKREYAPQA